MDDRIQYKQREQDLRELRKKIHDPDYLQIAVKRLAGKLTKEYYQRTQRGSNT